MTDDKTLTQQDRPLFWLSLTAGTASDLYKYEYACMEQLRFAKPWCGGIILKLPAWQEAPDALSDRLVKQAIWACKCYGIPFYLARNLWISWPDLARRATGEVQYLDDPVNLWYYHAFLAGLYAEAKDVGAAGTGVDAESYGDCLFNFKTGRFAENTRARVREAMRRAAGAIGEMGHVDLVYPAGSTYAKHVVWTFREFGKTFLHHKTFIAKRVHHLPPMNPPEGEKVQLNYWGSRLGPGYLSVADYHALTLVDIQAKHSECKGKWVWTPIEERAEVMKAFAEAADG